MKRTWIGAPSLQITLETVHTKVTDLRYNLNKFCAPNQCVEIVT